ncbi:MAG: Spx/MgsR family RNA polymerase-binding regulatory protein [Azoarcus sp.]|jgi:Spx/MgsR family transcriptional regulator|nr:Spx/MgsR family RNA polymerase-binding regulatory protein [Azoarcus sp.]
MENIIYGIKNCSTMKKTFDWFDEHGIAYRFHDYKKEGMDDERLRAWSARLGWEKLVNTKGPTWRKLIAAGQPPLNDIDEAITLLIANTSLIKRPMIETAAGELIVGFDPGTLEDKLGKHQGN